MRPWLGGLLLALAACGSGEPPSAATPMPAGVAFATLPGWTEDRVAEAVSAFRRGCALLATLPASQPMGGAGPLARNAGDFAPACAAAATLDAGNEAAARQFFQRHFVAVPIGQDILTGYYEPELRGSLTRDARFATPLYGLPPAGPMPTRAQIMAGALAGRGLELAWVDDPVDAFFLQVQGSGRIVLRDGRVLRLGYAGQNGQRYFAIGRTLVARGVMTAETASMQSIRAWMRQAGPAEAEALMARNPSYVFFKPLEGLAADEGPLGTLRAPLTPGRSLAVDQAAIPLGAPVWLAGALRRMAMAQDTGGAIRGAARADLFTGWGAAATEQAGRMRNTTALWVLVPRQ